MTSDRITKSILGLITILLAVIALRPSMLNGSPRAQATDYTGVQFSVTTNEDAFYNFFDPRNGDVWTYDKKGDLVEHRRLNGLGRPMMSSSR